MEFFVKMALISSVLSMMINLSMLGRGRSARWISLLLGGMVFALISVALGERGELRGACPLFDMGEVFLFIAWSLSLFYVLTGGIYRISLLGLFTAPLVSLFLGMVLLPGMLTEVEAATGELDPWKESHAATSVLSYGALGLAALASMMFLILDKRLKAQLSGGLSSKMPPVSTLVDSVKRLLVLGVVILTLGIVAGFVSHQESGLVHLLVAGAVWVAYVALLVWYYWRGLPPRILARAVILLFVLSCGIFIII